MMHGDEMMREADERRWNIETRSHDSASLPLSFNPTANRPFQISHRNPEQLEPDVEARRRSIFSASYQQPPRRGDWLTTFALGPQQEAGERLDGVLLESTFVLAKARTFFGHVERVENDALFEAGTPLRDRIFKVNKLSAGYIYDFARSGPARWGVGGLVSFRERISADTLVNTGSCRGHGADSRMAPDRRAFAVPSTSRSVPAHSTASREGA